MGRRVADGGHACWQPLPWLVFMVMIEGLNNWVSHVAARREGKGREGVSAADITE